MGKQRVNIIVELQSKVRRESFAYHVLDEAKLYEEFCIQKHLHENPECRGSRFCYPFGGYVSISGYFYNDPCMTCSGLLLPYIGMLFDCSEDVFRNYRMWEITKRREYLRQSRPPLQMEMREDQSE